MYYLLPVLIYIYYNYPDYLSLLQRLFRKLFFPINYTVPKLDQLDYPLPPFPNTWYPICSSDNIKQNNKYDFKIASKNIILFRNDKGIIQGVPRNCPHMGVDLMYGNIDNNCIICPMHCKRVSNNVNKKVFLEELKFYLAGPVNYYIKNQLLQTVRFFKIDKTLSLLTPPT